MCRVLCMALCLALCCFVFAWPACERLRTAGCTCRLTHSKNTKHNTKHTKHNTQNIAPKTTQYRHNTPTRNTKHNTKHTKHKTPTQHTTKHNTQHNTTHDIEHQSSNIKHQTTKHAPVGPSALSYKPPGVAWPMVSKVTGLWICLALSRRTSSSVKTEKETPATWGWVGESG